MKATYFLLWYFLCAGSSYSFASLIHPAVGLFSLPLLMPVLWRVLSEEPFASRSPRRSASEEWTAVITRPSTHVPHRVER